MLNSVKRYGREGERRGRRGAHTNSIRFLVSIAFSSFSGPEGEVGDNCTRVVMVTAEPHILTLNRTSATLCGGPREGGGGRGT